MTPFAAVLLAGGQSRRMGRDKALLPLSDGRLLWERQLSVLQKLQPSELFVSGVSRDGFPPSVRCLADRFANRGPLGGIAAALEEMTSPRLVVLAVDLPAMTTDFLSGLLAWSDQSRAGVVPERPQTGLYEPLAAVYPKACAEPANNLLNGNDWSLQNFVRTVKPLLHPHEITAQEEHLFFNWNQPPNLNGETTPAA